LDQSIVNDTSSARHSSSGAVAFASALGDNSAGTVSGVLSLSFSLGNNVDATTGGLGNIAAP